MDSSKIAKYLSKLLIEDDEADLIRFSFPDENRKIKCSKSFLSEISLVFGKMFSGTWLTETTIKLEDDVTFDQYSTFKLFLEIIYELRDVSSLSVNEATAVYFYTDKYSVMDVTMKIQTYLNKRMEASVNEHPVSVAELNDGLQFAKLYKLDDFKKKLDKVELDFNEENPVQFFDLAIKFQLDSLKEQVIQHLKTIEPNDTWTHEVSNSVVKCLQKELKEEIKRRDVSTKKIGSPYFLDPCLGSYIEY